MAADIDACHCGLAQPQAGPSTALRGDQRAGKLRKVRIVTHDQHRLLSGVFCQHRLKISEFAAGLQAGISRDLLFETDLRSHQRSGLQGAIQRAGNDRVESYAHCGQVVADQKALLLAFLVQAALAVEQRVMPASAGTCMTEDIKDHKKI